MKKNIMSVGMLALLGLLSACGGGGGGDVSIISGGGSVNNTVAVTVDSGPQGGSAVNVPYVSVTVCAPGGGQCQTIDHVMVDTGSQGLRLLASEITGLDAALPQAQINGQTLAQCAQFASGYTWGTVRRADVKLAGEVASNIPVEVIGGASAPAAPSACTGTGADVGSLAKMGARGILGVGLGQYDCSDCVSNASNTVYFQCASGTCVSTAVPAAQQVRNPVVSFASDNNGVALQLPAVGANGAPSASGQLTFGIATQANNVPAAGVKGYTTDNGGNIDTLYKGSLMSGFLDSGSNGLYFPDSTIATCSGGWFCPSGAPLNLSASLTARSSSQNSGTGSSGLVAFGIANAGTLFSSGNTAFNNLGAPSSGLLLNQFDWGLPFFYGRTVYTGIVGMNTPWGKGPVFAF